MELIDLVKVRYPGLWKERLPSGANRWRVRQEGNKHKVTVLPVGPDHKEFMECYRAARAGIKPSLAQKPVEREIPRSLGWLIENYLFWLADQVEANAMSPLTLKQRAHQLRKIKQDYGAYDLAMPAEKIIQIRDSKASTPGEANNTVKSLRALFRWACERGITGANPATGIANLRTPDAGAKPWSLDDLQKYRKYHAPGTQAHMALTLLLFTACRVSDAVLLGRHNETTVNGQPCLAFQPVKKGSAPVRVPMLPPLIEARDALKIEGRTYLLNSKGSPWKSPDAFRNAFREWCDQAGLENLSAHGIRKATGSLLAEHGATPFAIMALHGHTQPKTSERYTRSANRARLAADALGYLKDIEW